MNVATDEQQRAETEVEHLKQQVEIKRALKQTAGHKEESKPQVAPRQKLFLSTYAVLLASLGVVYYLFSLAYFNLHPQMRTYLQRYTRGAILIVLVLLAEQLVNAYLISRLDDVVSRYNLGRVLRLLTALVLVLIIVSVVFINWYTAVVSLGLISLILGFALQTPITSFIGWVYILVRAPYRVGDRIKIEDATGDVIDVSYLDTTLWEFGGQYLSTDHPSGRVIKFPNSNVLHSAVYNYSWPLFPYIWNEISFQIAYESDLEFVAKVMQETAEEEIGQLMMERIRTYRELLAQTPVDQLEVREHPAVLFRINQNTWLDATVRYLVKPREAGRVKTRLIKKILERLNAEPERVMFPKGDAR